jgi:hypothetical protein
VLNDLQKHRTQAFLVLWTVLVVSPSRQLVTSPPSIHLVFHLLMWFLIISPVGSFGLGIVFDSVLDLVVFTYCQHYSQSHLYIAWCLWYQIILVIISCFLFLSGLQMFASGDSIFSCCFTVACLFCIFNHHNVKS